MAPAEHLLDNTRAAPKHDAGSKDVLGYLDQGFFTSLRALRRQPIIYFLWLYVQPLDEAAVRLFSHRLAQGRLGRLLQRSPLPWGRHRWVAHREPAPVTWYRDEIPIECLHAWRNSLIELPLDPEYGPGWRLAVQSLQGGGAALALIVSHTIADGKAATQAIAEAVAGQCVESSFPAPSWRWSPGIVVRDSIESLRGLPGLCGALKTLMRQPRARPPSASTRQRPSQRTRDEPGVVLPVAEVIIDQQALEKRAAELGVKGNTLITAIAVRLAFRIGRVDGTGRVELVLPVSDRLADDWRGNALRAVTVMADPETCHSNPRTLLEDIRAALTSQDGNNADLSSLLPLTPYVPRWLVRYFEWMTFGARLPVGCSLLGELPADVSRPCGEATYFQISNVERYTASLLEQLRGGMFLVGFRLEGRVLLNIVGHMPNRVTTCAELRPQVYAALADLGLEGTVR